jgi:predicted nucleic acid-binding protein
MTTPSFFVVDTNVLSNPGDLGDKHVRQWLGLNRRRIAVSVITFAEMRRGLMMLQKKIDQTADPKVAKRDRERLARKTAWYNDVTSQFSSRLIPIDLAVAEKWAQISVKFPFIRDGDQVIAASALSRGYGVATENLGDFKVTGIPEITIVNPFDPNTWIYDDDDDPISSLLSPK